MSKPERNKEDVETIHTHKRNHMGISVFAAKLIKLLEDMSLMHG